MRTHEKSKGCTEASQRLTAQGLLRASGTWPTQHTGSQEECAFVVASPFMPALASMPNCNRIQDPFDFRMFEFEEY